MPESKSLHVMPGLVPGIHVFLLAAVQDVDSRNGLARAVHVAPRRINEIVLGKRDITADTDLRLARYFGLSEGFFLGLQMDYDLMQRRREIDRDLKAIRPRAA